MRTLLAVLVMAMGAIAAQGEDILVYNGGGTDGIVGAMAQLGLTYDLRTPSSPVTLADLASHKVLVVGWNENGTMSGLAASVLESGITGNILVTGHDPDYHMTHAPTVPAAKTFLSQAISFGEAYGTGLVVLAGVPVPPFGYLPSSWGIVASNHNLNTITSITAAGQSSGVYDGLTPASLSGWGVSYHNWITAMGPGFTPFEYDGGNVVTIGKIVPEPATLSLLALGGLAVMRRRK